MATKINITADTIHDMCDMFRQGHSIPEIMSKYSLGRNKITAVLKDALRDEYAQCVRTVMLQCSQKSAKTLTGRKMGPHTPEWNRKISESQRGKKLSEETRQKIRESTRTREERGVWTSEMHAEAMQRAVQTKRNRGYYEVHSARHSKWMQEHAPLRGKKLSDESRKRMSDAQRKAYANGKIGPRTGDPKSPAERKKLSESTKRMWREGRFTYGGSGVFRSKLEKRAFDAISKLYPGAAHSHRITSNEKTYVFDICIPSLSLLIEVNGDYWHMNPKKYPANYVDASRNTTAQGIWDADARKREAGITAGFRVITLWESDLKQAANHPDEQPSNSLADLLLHSIGAESLSLPFHCPP